MKNLIKNYSCILFLGFLGFSVNVQAQNTWNPSAPMNPIPLRYMASHFGFGFLFILYTKDLRPWLIYAVPSALLVYLL